MPPTSLQLRTVDVDDDAVLDRWMSTTAMIFHAPFLVTPERRDFRRDELRTHRLTGMFDGDQLVSTYRSWDWQLTLPGGTTVTTDAISSVTVRASHRRRGALTAMITADLADAARRGLPAAVLIASEAGIYRRFGFGPATESATWALDLGQVRIGGWVPRVGSVEVVTPQELRPVAPQVFADARGPGDTDRSTWWWDSHTEVTRAPGDTPRPRFGVLYRDPAGTPAGYLLYTAQEEYRGRVNLTTASVDDLQAATPAAYAALWTFLAELDLVATVRADDRRADEPLPALLADPRTARRESNCDFLWTRLLDPVAALSARRYETAGTAVFELTDPLGYATGRYRLEVDGAGTGVAARTDATAELTLPVDQLSAGWLGGGDLLAAHAAGRIDEHVPGGVQRLALLLRTLRAPWSGTWF